jgi:flagellar hook protein FlgE
MSTVMGTSTLIGTSWLDDSWQEDVDDWIGDADAALASSPAVTNLSRYLPSREINRAMETTLETPVTLASIQPSLGCSHEKSADPSGSKLSINVDVANFLDYLNNIRFDQTPAHKHRAVSIEEGDDETYPAQAVIKPTSRNHRVIEHQVEETSNITPASRTHDNEFPRNVLMNRTNNRFLCTKKNIGTLINSFHQTSALSKTIEIKSLPPSPENPSEKAHRPVAKQKQSPQVKVSHGRGLHETFNDSISTSRLMEVPTELKEISENDWARLQAIELKLEIALREAYSERQSAREWAQAMQKSVQRWIKEQRNLIHLERKQAAETVSEKSRSEIQVLRDAVTSSVHDFDIATLNHQNIVQNLKDIIQVQAKTISSLEKNTKEPVSQQDHPYPDSKNAPMMNTYGPVNIVDCQSSTPVDFLSLSKQFKNSRLDPPGSDSSTQSELQSCHYVSSETSGNQSREVRTTADGRRILKYRNGAEKEIRSDGTCTIRYSNGDTKSVAGDVTSYYHATEKVRKLNSIFVHVTSVKCMLTSPHLTPSPFP